MIDRRHVCTLLVLLSFAATAHAQSASPAASMVKLLQAGRVPADRVGSLLKLICTRGESADLQVVYDQARRDDHWPVDVRITALESLLEAAQVRKVTIPDPGADFNALMAHPDRKLVRVAIPLAGAWSVAASAPLLEKITLNPEAPAELRRSALRSLTLIDPSIAVRVEQELSNREQPYETRSWALAEAVRRDPTAAIPLSARLLAAAGPRDSTAILLEAVLDQKGGAEQLAAALSEQPPAPDVAKRLLRQMYSWGRTDAALSQRLSDWAGLSETDAPLTPERLAQLVQAVVSEGDPRRGEEVFRRADLSCFKCHALSKAGGQIGPDLSAIGASSPIEYLLTSVLDPDQAIKEAYATKVIATVDGKVIQGLIADRTADALVLKDANGQLHQIPVADIEDEIEGKSLMPKGLVKFMTEAELIDLAAFLSELGKPGPFGVRESQRFQRYRVLQQPAEVLLERAPTTAALRDLVLDAPQWTALYARVNGEVPLGEATALGGAPVVFLQGEIDCQQPGPVLMELDSAEGVDVWLEDRECLPGTSIPLEMSPGRLRLTIRIDGSKRSTDVIRAVLRPAPGSSAEFRVIDGP